MANRPVFVPMKKAPFADVYPTEFNWNPGCSVSQKQKNVTALHDAFARRFPHRNPLEISSKSLQPLGIRLSAFNLKKFVPSLGRSVPLECVFQGGKVFAVGGPFTDLYTGTARAAKGDPRLKTSGMLRSFFFEGETFPLSPATAFYNWLYINALLENEDLARDILAYDSFTDIEFNPGKSLNCQAEAAAAFISLHQLGLLEQCRGFSSFAALLRK